MSGPIDKISWLAEIFISLQGGRVLLVWSVVSGGPKQSVGCWSCVSPPVVLVWSASRVQLLFTVISPGGVWLEDLSQHSLTFLTQHSQLQASLCGLGLISALRSSVADWDPGPGLTQFYKIEPGGNSATQSWTKWIDTDFL